MKTFLHVGCGPVYFDSNTQQEQRIKEIDGWLLEMAGGVEKDYFALLKRVSLYEKDDKEHFLTKIDQLKNKPRWTNKVHHVTREMYEAWANTDAAKKAPSKPEYIPRSDAAQDAAKEEYPGESELPF